MVLSKDACLKREVVDTSDAFITTTSKALGFSIPMEVLLPPPVESLVGVIELSTQDNLLASRAY